jgi:MFS family permease
VTVAASLALWAVSRGGGAPPTGLVVAVALVYGLGMAFVPQTRLAMLANVTSPERLRQATVTVSLINTIALAAGPALVGAIAAATSWATAFLAIALCWTASTLLAVVTPTARVSAGAPVERGSVRAIGRYLRGDAVVRSLIGMVAVSILFLFGPLQVLVPVFAGDVLGLDDGGRGALMGVLGVGIVIGGVTALRARRLAHLPRWLVGCALAALLLPLALAGAGSFAAAAVVVLGVGAAGGFFASVAPGIVQTSVGDGIRGRAMAAYVVVRWGLPALGAAGAGLVADAIGLRPALVAYALTGALLHTLPARTFLRSVFPHAHPRA